MKHFRTIAILVLALAITAPAAPAFAVPGVTGQTSAAPGPASGKIYITAIVAPKRTIIVNETGKIVEIASNTEQDVVPVVYIGKPTVESKRTLSVDLYRQYRTLVPEGIDTVGILYGQAGAAPADSKGAVMKTPAYLLKP